MFFRSIVFLLLVSSVVSLHALQNVPRVVMKQGRTIQLEMKANQEISKELKPNHNPNNPNALAYAALWSGLLVYAFNFAPGGSPEMTALDNELITKMIQTPFDGTTNPIFVALFNSLGIIPAVYASLLLPGSKNQKVPALPFVIASFALGFFGVGPYLGLRNIQTDVKDEQRGRGSGLFESKITSFALLGFGIYLLYFACTDNNPNNVEDFISLFSTQRLAHVSTCDFTILSLAMYDPLKEDMKRRRYEDIPAVAFCSLPVLGPVLWLLLRPSLPK